MTENDETVSTESGIFASKFWRVLLVIVSVFLIFAGPTYVIYGLTVLLNASIWASFVVGFVLLVVGLVLMRYLFSKKIVS